MQKEGMRVGVYHAGLAAAARHKVHMDFLRDNLDVVRLPDHFRRLSAWAFEDAAAGKLTLPFATGQPVASCHVVSEGLADRSCGLL